MVTHMNTAATTTAHCVSSTDMLHVTGCSQLASWGASRSASATANITDEAAAAWTGSRCSVCAGGTASTPAERRTAKAAKTAAALAAQEARRAENVARTAAAWTPEADAALAAFLANENAETFAALRALAPAGESNAARAKALGL